MVLDFTSGLRFYLDAKQEICLNNEVIFGDELAGKFESTETLQVTASTPDNMIYQNLKASKGRITSVANIEGSYRTCFTNLGKVQAEVSVTLHTGADAKDYATLARESNLKPVEIQLKRLEDTANEIVMVRIYITTV